jgi:hypothetical protein
MNTKKILFFTACLCLSAAMHAQINLSFNPTIGETYTTRFVTETTVTQSIMGMTMPMNIEMGITMDMTATEKNDNEVTVDFSYSSLSLQMSSMMMNLRLDSDDDISTLSGPERDMAEILNALIETTANVVFGRDGSVISISGLDATSNLDPLNPMMAAFQSMFNEDVLRQMLEQSFNVYPPHAINVGDSWHNNTTVTAQGMQVVSNITYTLRSIVGNYALIDIVSVSTSTSVEAGATGEIAGEFIGEMKLDIPTGMVINSSLEGNSSGTLAVEMMEIGMEMTSRTTMTLVR